MPSSEAMVYSEVNTFSPLTKYAQLLPEPPRCCCLGCVHTSAGWLETLPGEAPWQRTGNHFYCIYHLEAAVSTTKETVGLPSLCREAGLKELVPPLSTGVSFLPNVATSSVSNQENKISSLENPELTIYIPSSATER